MAVLVEAISVIVRKDSIDNYYTGGWTGFKRAVPNQSMCTDEEVVRVGFMKSDDAVAFVEGLEQQGLVFLENDNAVDIVICYQGTGPTTDCDWIEFGELPISAEVCVSAAWLFEGPWVAAGRHLKQKTFALATPVDWEPASSESERMHYLSPEDMAKDLEFLREENGVEVYWNKQINKEVYIGITTDSGPVAPPKRLS